MAPAPGVELPVAVDYQPAATGPFLWQAFPAAAVAADLAAIAAAGFRLVRVGLAWDSFMPDAAAVDRRRLTELGALLRAATASGLRVVPALFVQAHGDCVLLPRRAVRRTTGTPRVRVLSEGQVEPGRPRDPWTDPLMLELADRWARTMAAELAGHPAVAGWDLGDDPASAARPRRIGDLAAWVALAGAPFRERGDPVTITLGAGDILRARGVRLAALAPLVDRIDLAVRPAQLRQLGLSVTEALLFLAGLAQRLTGDPGCPVGLAAALPSPPPEGSAPAPRAGGEAPDPGTGSATPGAGEPEGGEAVAEGVAAGAIDELLERREEGGVAGLRAMRWCDLNQRLAERPPYDRSAWLLRCGLVRADGTARPLLEPWARAARAEHAICPPRPWPAHIDTRSYYADLPDSVRDLAAAWAREVRDHPAILAPG